MNGSYADRHGRGHSGSRHADAIAQEALELQFLAQMEATQMSPGKHRRHQPAYSAGGDYSLPDSPARHSRSGGGSSYGSPSKSLGHQSPEGHQQRRLQRQLARRVHGVLPPEQRYMPPSRRKGTDDAARRALIAHLKEVDEAMDRINKSTRSRRPPSQTQRLKARQTVSMPVSPFRRERAAERDTAPPPYAPQLQNKAAGGRQQPSFEVHANASSQAPAAQFAAAAPQSQPGLPKLVRQNAFSGVAPQARSTPSSKSPSKTAGLTRRASGLPTIKESHVSLAALLSAPARLSPDNPALRRGVPQRPGPPMQQAVDGERRRRSEAQLNARLNAHPGVIPAHPRVAPAAHTSAARALWPDSAASSPERLGEGIGAAGAGGRPDADGVPSAAAAADEPTPPRAVPAAALWAQPLAPLPHSQLPQGPFAFSAPGSVRRYSSPAASPPQWRPMRSVAPHGAAAGGSGTGVSAQPPAAASTPADVPVGPAPAAEAAGGGDGSDWEDAGRWLEPDAPGATAALRTALAALAAGTPPNGSGRSRRRNASAPGSRHTSAPGSPTAGSRRPSFTQPLPWTPAGAPGTDRRRWFEQITEADGAPLSLARRTPLPRGPLDIEPSRQPAIAGTMEAEEEEPQATPSNLAGLLEAASDDAAEPIAELDSAPALALPGECPPQAAAVEDEADAQRLAAGCGNDARDAAEEPQPEAAQQQDDEVVQSVAARSEAPREFPLPGELPETCSGTNSADSAERSSGSSSPAERAAETAEVAEAVEAAAPQGSSAAAAGFATAVSVAAEPGADTSGHRRRRWRRIAPRSQAPSPSPPGTAPASPLQRSPRQLGAAPLTGTTRAPGSPEPHVASATKRPRISPPPGVIAGADAAASAPATPEQPQPRSAMAVPPFVLPEDAAEADPLEEAATMADDSEQTIVGTAAAAAVQAAAHEAPCATAAAAGPAGVCTEQQPAAAPSAEEPTETSVTEAAAGAAEGAAASGSPQASSGKYSEPDEQLLPPETVANEAGTENVMAPEDYVSNFNEDMNEEEDLTPSSGEDLASSSTVDSTAGAEAAAFQAAAAAAAARAGAAASPPWRPSDDGSPDRAHLDTVQPPFPGSAAPQEEGHSPSGSLSSVFEDEAEASFQLGGFTPFAPFSPFTPALAAAAAAAEADGEEDREQAVGGARLRFGDPPVRGDFTSEIEPAEGPAEEELAAADTAVAMRDMPDVPTCSTHHIGAALLELQPGMASAPAGEVAAALAHGVAMHKAWIHAAKQPASGSNRTICWKVAGGEVMLSYQRGLMRRNVSTVMYRVYLLDNNALAVDTAQGVLILRMPDAALHAMVVLGINAALTLASGQARKSTAVADLPWSADIMLDDSIVD